MGDVVELNGATVADDRRTSLIAHFAACYDSYVRAHGHEPDGVVFMLGGTHQPVNFNWNVIGDASRDNGVHAFLCKASFALQQKLILPNG